MHKKCLTCLQELSEQNWILKGKYIRNICKKCRSKQQIEYEARDINRRRQRATNYLRKSGKVKQYPCETCKALCYKKYSLAFCSDKCRFMFYVVCTGTCWLWTGTKNRAGYGKLCFKNNNAATAHRVSYLLFKGEIPAGMCVCHTCDNPACVKPDHLWLGTTQENTADMVKKNRSLRGEKSTMAKVTEADVIAIRKLNSLNIAQNKISKMFNLTAGHINNIIKKRVWKHIIG